MKTIKIIGSVYTGPEFKSRKFNVPSILVPIVKDVLGFFWILCNITMDYKQKYEEALETARKINSGEGVAAPKDWSTLEVIFPELRKSENEKIKTNIIKLLRFVRDTHHQYSDECNEAINWLENNPMFDMSKIKFKVDDYTMKTIINEVKRLNNDINNTITELVKARLAHNDAAVANIHHKMESLMVETQQVCSFIIDNLPNENLDEAADCYLENIQPVGFMEGDYDGTQILDAFRTGADWQKNRDKQILSTLYDDCSCLKNSLDKVTTGNLSHRIGNIKFSITGMQVLIKQATEGGK